MADFRALIKPILDMSEAHKNENDGYFEGFLSYEAHVYSKNYQDKTKILNLNKLWDKSSSHLTLVGYVLLQDTVSYFQSLQLLTSTYSWTSVKTFDSG